MQSNTKIAPSRNRECRVLILVLSVLCASVPLLSASAAERVVSLNLCTDQMLVLLAPEKVAALSPLARDPALSFVAPQAMRLPIVHASAEAVLRLHPDLVLAAPFGAQTTLAVLQQEGLHILRIGLPQDFTGIRKQTRELANALGVPQRGEALIAAMDITLNALPHPRGEIRALVWEPRGLTAGPGTLMDAVLHAAGLTNASDGRRVSLEAMLRHPPDLLIVPTEPAFPSLATDLLDHPALEALRRREIAPPLSSCGGPFTAQAATLLAR
jgi:iron complex transport system substrate-binding protein